MPRGRPRTRTDSTTERVIRIMMDIRPKTVRAEPEPDIPLPTTLVNAPIFAAALRTLTPTPTNKSDDQSEHKVGGGATAPIADPEAKAIGSDIGSEQRLATGGAAEPRSKPFICFYCGFQCESHLMRHRCVPKKKRRTLSLDFESYEPKQPIFKVRRNDSEQALESEAAEILSVMLQSA